MHNDNDYMEASITSDNTSDYPLHRHSCWEVMCYLKGIGYLKTEKGKIVFEPSTIICVSPSERKKNVIAQKGFKI